MGSGKEEFGKLVKPGIPLHLEDGFFYGSPQAHKKPPKWVTHKGVAHAHIQPHLHLHEGNEINKAAKDTKTSVERERWAHGVRKRGRDVSGERDRW